MVHWLEYGGIRSTMSRESKQLEELQRYLKENPTAKAEGFWKTTGDMFAKFVRLECQQSYADLDLDCNSGFDKSLKRHAHKPSNIEYSETLTQEINGLEFSREIPHEKGENHVMDEHTSVSRDTPVGDAPLMENQYVKELFSILQDNGRDSSGLSALLGHVSEMENFVKRSEDKIAEMKSQLADMKEVQNHPVKNALQNAIKTLENKVAAVKEQLAELKGNIIEGCKNAVAAFKEKGITALDKLASFFHIKQGLQDWKKDVDSIIRTDDKAVAKIEAFASEYHTAGRAIKNMARVAVGKQPIDAKKEAGKLAKTLSAPYKAQKAALTGLRKSIDKAITKLDRLESTAAKQAERAAEKKPSMLAKLDANKERVEREKRELPTPERTKSQAVEV